jgi:hypothetical protein
MSLAMQACMEANAGSFVGFGWAVVMLCI